VIGIRIVWVLLHHLLAQLRRRPETAQSAKGSVVIAWSGMRGIVTLAAAMALPGDFPHRDFIELTAFVVVLGTLVIQGMTLRPLLVLLRLPKDSVIESELHVARKAALQAALTAIDGDESPAAERLRVEYSEALSQARQGHNPRDRRENVLRQRAIAAGRTAINELRSSDAIGDDAYRRMEEELDWLELSSRPARPDV